MMDDRDSAHDDRFRPRTGPPKQRGQAFVGQVLRHASKSGAHALPGSTRPGARLGRGHVVAQFGRARPSIHLRRVAVKTRLVNLQRAGRRSASTHLRYIEREGVGRDGEPGQAYGALTDEADIQAFEARGRDDRHQFRLIVSPEDADSLDDLRTFTRHLMERVSSDLGTRLDWVAVDHWNTDNPHTHIVLRGKDESGRDLVIARDYIAHGMRERASALATDWLGLRTEREIMQSAQREVTQDRWTSLDRMLARQMPPEGLQLNALERHPRRQQLIGRLQHLERLGLARQAPEGHWRVFDHAERTLREMGERGDILRTMQRAMAGTQRDLHIIQPGHDGSIIGRVAARGLTGESHDLPYLIVDGTDGRAHHVTLARDTQLSSFPVDAIVEVRGTFPPRAMDTRIAGLAVDGLYARDTHRNMLGMREPNVDRESLLDAHERRLEALRRAGIVERIGNGLWRVPQDLSEQGRRYDAQRSSGLAVVVHSRLPIDRQVRAMGATWLDAQLVGRAAEPATPGFGAEVRTCLRERADFLAELGLAQRRGERTSFIPNLLGALRQRELAVTVKEIEERTGLRHHTPVEGVPVTGIYRRYVDLASGRYAQLEHDGGFSLVPWKPVIEPRRGQSVTARVQRDQVSWKIGRSRGRVIE
jgi:type IV secretory pathway VirD2 relaxase